MLASGDPVVIQTKLVPSVRESGLVTRDRLLTKLSDSIESTVVIIKAPAGYGKTTLVGQWFTSLNPDTNYSGWYSLGDTDNNIGRFFTYLVAALRLKVQDFGTTILVQLNACQSGAHLSTGSLSGAFVNEIASLGKRVSLVLDDFHLLHNNDIGKAMEQITRNAPANLHLVIVSRETPQLPLGRLRVLGRVVEVTVDELRFRRSEIGSFFSRAGLNTLSYEQIYTLEKATEGWVAGLQLASISLADRNDVDEFIRAFSGSYGDVVDFLTEDVLQRQDKETREFMLYTSILDRLCPSLCDAVTTSNNGHRMLNLLKSRGLFLFSLDDEKEWYRYHHLFSHFLRKCLIAENPDIVNRLHHNASAWFAEQDLIDEAIQHALVGKDEVTAARLLNQACDDLFYNGRLSTLTEWYKQIPAVHLRKYPRILLDQAWSEILEWRFSLARSMLDEVHALLEESSAGGEAESELIFLRSILKHRNMMYAQSSDDMPLVEELCLEMLDNFSVDDSYLLGNLSSSLINAKRDLLEFDQVEILNAQAMKHYERSGSHFVLIWHNTILGISHLAEGKLEQAERALFAALKIAKEISGEVSPLAAMPGLLLAEVWYEQNKIEESERFLKRYLPLADQIGFVDQLISGYICQSRLLYTSGDHTKAKAILNQAKQHAIKYNFARLEFYVVAEQVRQALRAVDVEAATAYGEQIAALEAKQVMPGERVRSQDVQLALTWCRLAPMKKDLLNDAITVGRRWFRFTQGRGAIRAAVEFGVVLAQALQRQGEKTATQRCLREVLAMASTTDIKRTLMDTPELTRGLIDYLASDVDNLNDPLVCYAQVLLGEAHPQESLGVGRAPEPISDDIVYPVKPLSRRERDILELVANGFRNREIANELGLTEGSVKWYLQQIYNKIGARRRSLAVQRARDLGFMR